MAAALDRGAEASWGGSLVLSSSAAPRVGGAGVGHVGREPGTRGRPAPSWPARSFPAEATVSPSAPRILPDALPAAPAAAAAQSPPVPSGSAFLFIPFLFFSLVKVEEEATDKDNKNCSKDNMCSKVIGLKTNSICAL